MIFYNSSTEKNGMNSSSVSMASLQRIQVTSSRLQAVHEIQWNPQEKQKKVRNSRGEFEIADSNWPKGNSMGNDFNFEITVNSN